MKESQNEINYARIAEAIRFYATCCIESELLYVKSLNNGLVKVTDKCCKKKEHCVLCHGEQTCHEMERFTP